VPGGLLLGDRDVDAWNLDGGRTDAPHQLVEVLLQLLVTDDVVGVQDVVLGPVRRLATDTSPERRRVAGAEPRLELKVAAASSSSRVACLTVPSPAPEPGGCSERRVPP
jgi:hypothetical protein